MLERTNIHLDAGVMLAMSVMFCYLLVTAAPSFPKSLLSEGKLYRACDKLSVHCLRLGIVWNSWDVGAAIVGFTITMTTQLNVVWTCNRDCSLSSLLLQHAIPRKVSIYGQS